MLDLSARPLNDGHQMRLLASAKPRIHVGLVDLAGVSARTFCGVGFSISDPSTCWSVANGRHISIRGTSHLDDVALADLNRIVEALQEYRIGGFSATLERSPLQHIGLGTKTSLLLSLISAIDRLKTLGLSVSQIQEMSGRGGASGVGINLFFCGGIVWDGGHPRHLNREFLPSSASKVRKIPPMLARWPFPDHWLVGLVLPDYPSFSGTSEISFFKSNTPISSDEALRTMSSMYHGVIPAFASADIDLLKEALEELHLRGFKHRELFVQSQKTIRTMEALRKLERVAVGLSSLGPLIYGIFDRHDFASQRQFQQTAKAIGANYLGTFAGCNTGFTVELR